MRPTIHETLMDSARVWARRSTCSRLNVGAVAADHRGVILSSGYNGPLSGMPHCDHSTTDEPCRLALHAEANTLLWAARRGVPLEGARLYVTHEPCYECAKAVVQAGISAVYYGESYGRNSGTELLARAGVYVGKV